MEHEALWASVDALVFAEVLTHARSYLLGLMPTITPFAITQLPLHGFTVKPEPAWSSEASRHGGV